MPTTSDPTKVRKKGWLLKPTVERKRSALDRDDVHTADGLTAIPDPRTVTSSRRRCISFVSTSYDIDAHWSNLPVHLLHIRQCFALNGFFAYPPTNMISALLHTPRPPSTYQLTIQLIQKYVPLNIPLAVKSSTISFNCSSPTLLFVQPGSVRMEREKEMAQMRVEMMKRALVKR